MTIDPMDALGPLNWAASPSVRNGTTPMPLRARVADPAPRSLADYLDAVVRFTCRYVAFPSEHDPVAVALWVVHTHVVDRVETSPILAVTSAEMRSGKTRLLDVLELLVPHPERSVLPSESVIYTLLSQDPRRRC